MCDMNVKEMAEAIADEHEALERAWNVTQKRYKAYEVDNVWLRGLLAEIAAEHPSVPPGEDLHARIKAALETDPLRHV